MQGGREQGGNRARKMALGSCTDHGVTLIGQARSVPSLLPPPPLFRFSLRSACRCIKFSPAPLDLLAFSENEDVVHVVDMRRLNLMQDLDVSCRAEAAAASAAAAGAGAGEGSSGLADAASEAAEATTTAAEAITVVAVAARPLPLPPDKRCITYA